MISEKPLGIKAYGSIPHLPSSRLGTGDHHCHEGQARIATEKTRDKHDYVIVQEKLDGSNVAVTKVDGKILALTRSGYLANTSKYEQHHKFVEWVEDNYYRFYELLMPGERVCGEWLLQAHGTRYALPHEPFVAFDLIYNQRRLDFAGFEYRMLFLDFMLPKVLHRGKSSFSIENAIEAIKTSGHGAIDPVEGAVWRIERKGEIDFLVKYVRPDKEDGKYFPENNNGIITYNKLK